MAYTPIPILTGCQLRSILLNSRYNFNADDGDADTKILERAKVLAANNPPEGNFDGYDIFVWSYDSDFAVMSETPRCDFIDMARVEDKNTLDEYGRPVPTLSTIVYRKSKISEFLGISEAGLLEFCLYLGNDYCKHFDMSIKRHYTIGGEPLIMPGDPDDVEALNLVVFERIKRHPGSCIKCDDACDDHELVNLHLEFARLFYVHGEDYKSKSEALKDKCWKLLSKQGIGKEQKEEKEINDIIDDGLDGLTQISDVWMKHAIRHRNNCRSDRLIASQNGEFLANEDDFFFTLRYLDSLRGGIQNSSLLVYKNGLPKIRYMVDGKPVLRNIGVEDNSSSTSAQAGNSSTAVPIISCKDRKDVTMLAISNNHFIAFERMQRRLFRNYMRDREQKPDIKKECSMDDEFQDPVTRVHEIDWNEYQIMHLFQEFQYHFHGVRVRGCQVLDIEPRYLFDGVVFMHEFEKLQREFNGASAECNLDFDTLKKFGDNRIYPVDIIAADIINSTENNRVTLISGATGTGKSSGVPRIIVNHYKDGVRNGNCRILVIEPRRLVVENLYNRFVETMGGHMVGKRRGLERPVNYGAPIIFSTAGYILKRYLRNFDDLLRENFTHIIVDEVHERTMEYDILLLMMKHMLSNSSIKLILMSATPNFHLYEHFFYKSLVSQKIRRSSDPSCEISLKAKFQDKRKKCFVWIKNIKSNITEAKLKETINKCIEPASIKNLTYESDYAKIEFHSEDDASRFLDAEKNFQSLISRLKSNKMELLWDETNPFDGPDPDFHIHIGMENGKQSTAPYEVVYIDSDEFSELSKDLGDKFQVHCDKIIHSCESFARNAADNNGDDDDDEDDDDDSSDDDSETTDESDYEEENSKVNKAIASSNERSPISNYFQQRQFDVLHTLVTKKLMNAKAILVFVPGIGEAQKIADKFRRNSDIGVSVVHSSTERETSFDFNTSVSQENYYEKDDENGFLPIKYDPLNVTLYLSHIPEEITEAEIKDQVNSLLPDSPEGKIKFEVSIPEPRSALLIFLNRDEAIQASKHLYHGNQSLVKFYNSAKEDFVISKVAWYEDKNLLRVPDDPDACSLFIRNFPGTMNDLRSTVRELGVNSKFDCSSKRQEGNFLLTFRSKLDAIKAANVLYNGGKCQLSEFSGVAWEQKYARDGVPPKLRLIVATNVLESGVTVGDVNVVICLGTNNVKVYDSNSTAVRSKLTTTWINQASAQQRAGRTGRVARGVVYRLYTKAIYDQVFEKDIEPDWMRNPISDLIVKVSHVLESQQDNVPLSSNDEGKEPENLFEVIDSATDVEDTNILSADIHELFGSIPQPFKDRKKIEDSITMLSNLNVIRRHLHSDSYELTTCGKLINMMQVSVDIGVMLFFGVLLGIPTEMAVIATVLESSDSIFRDPKKKAKFHHPDFINSEARELYWAMDDLNGGVYSDPIMMLKIFKMYHEIKCRPKTSKNDLMDFNRKYYLNYHKTETFYTLARSKVLELNNAICEINNDLEADEIRRKSDGVFFFACENLDNKDPVLHLIRTVIAWNNGGNVIQTADPSIPLDRSISIENHPLLEEKKIKELFPRLCSTRIETSDLEVLSFKFEGLVERNAAFVLDMIGTFFEDPFRLQAAIVWRNLNKNDDSGQFQEVRIYIDSRKIPDARQILEQLLPGQDFSAIKVLDTNIICLRLESTLRSHLDISKLRNNFTNSLEFFIPRFVDSLWYVRLNNFPREYVKNFIRDNVNVRPVEMNSFNLNGHLCAAPADRYIDEFGNLVAGQPDSDDVYCNHYHIFFNDLRDSAIGTLKTVDEGPLMDLDYGRRLANVYAAISRDKKIRIGSYDLFEPYKALEEYQEGEKKVDDFLISRAYYCSNIFGGGIDLGVRRDSNKWKMKDVAIMHRAFVSYSSILHSSRLYFKDERPVTAVAGSVTFKRTTNFKGESLIFYECSGVTALPYSEQWLKVNLVLPKGVLKATLLAPDEQLIESVMNDLKVEIPNLMGWSPSHYLYMDNVRTQWKLNELFPSAISHQRASYDSDYSCTGTRKSEQAVLRFEGKEALERAKDNFFRQNREIKNYDKKTCIFSDRLRLLGISDITYKPKICVCQAAKNGYESRFLKISENNYCSRSFYSSVDESYEFEKSNGKIGLPTTCSGIKKYSLSYLFFCFLF